MRRRKVLLGVLGALVVTGGAGAYFVYSQMAADQGPRVDAGGVAVGIKEGVSYVWLVPTPRGAILVDAGNEGSAKDVLRELKSRNVPAAQVHTVLMTHAHRDHTRGLGQFPGARVMVGPGEAAGILDQGVPPQRVVEVGDGQVLDLDGVTVKVVLTPGHTRGSAVFLVGDLLFTGDTLMNRQGGLQMGPSLFSEDTEMNRASLRKLLDLPFDKVADGHAGYTVGAKAQLKAFLAGVN